MWRSDFCQNSGRMECPEILNVVKTFLICLAFFLLSQQ